MTGQKILSKKDRLPEVERLHNNGWSAAEIAKLFHVHERTIHVDLTDLAKRPRTRPGFPWTPELLAFAQSLLEDGCPYAEVARTLETSTATIQRKFPGHGATGNPIGNGKHMRIAEALGLMIGQPNGGMIRSG